AEPLGGGRAGRDTPRASPHREVLRSRGWSLSGRVLRGALRDDVGALQPAVRVRAADDDAAADGEQRWRGGAAVDDVDALCVVALRVDQLEPQPRRAVRVAAELAGDGADDLKLARLAADL